MKKQEFVSSIFTKNKNLCSGCGACMQICKHKAISMQEDSEGFLYPCLNESLCIKCGLCDKICPEVNDHQENKDANSRIYLAKTNLKRYYKKSATIGVCTMLTELILKKNGLVYGVELDEAKWKAKHISISDISQYNRIRNSKYIQSDTQSTYPEVLSKLKCGDLILYIGTPCQIAGLKAYLRKEYDNLFTIDLICHGTYSYKLLRKEVEYWQNKYKGNIQNFRFRSKRKHSWLKGGVINFDVITTKGKKCHIEHHGSCSPTYRCYAYSEDGRFYNLRPSCYQCPFREKGRYGDITVGDAWLLKNPGVYRNCKNGISLVMANTSKGGQLLEEIRDLIDTTQISMEQAFVQPALLPTHREIPAERNYLYDNLDKMNYGNLVESILNVNFEELNAEFLKKYRKEKRIKIIKEIIKKCILYGWWHN